MPKVTAAQRKLYGKKRDRAVNWHRIEYQGAMGSCQGNDLASCLECCYYQKTGDKIQFSRIFAYRETQKIDGIRGDQGSTISGGVKLARETGLPLETTVPYPNRYPSRFQPSQAAYDEAAKHKIRSHVRIDSPQQARDWILTNMGAVTLGISWPVRLSSGAVVKSFRGGGGGGHAIAILDYYQAKEKINPFGEDVFVVANSHGKNYGDHGWFYITRNAFSQMLSHRWTAAFGVSDMTTPKPRVFNPKKQNFIGYEKGKKYR